LLLGVYWPGSQALSAAFSDELLALLELQSVYSCPVVVCGDFNIHVDQPDVTHAIHLADLLSSFGCTQHVNEPTHTAGHILDLVISTMTTRIKDVRIGDTLSDHALVCFTLQLNKPAPATEYVTCRAWRRLSHDAFASDLAALKLCCDLDGCENMSVDDLVQLYNHVLTELLSLCDSASEE